jgi:hypothetical protein
LLRRAFIFSPNSNSWIEEVEADIARRWPQAGIDPRDVYAQVGNILDNDEECALYTLAGNYHEKLFKLNRSYSRPRVADKFRITLVKVQRIAGRL